MKYHLLPKTKDFRPKSKSNLSYTTLQKAIERVGSGDFEALALLVFQYQFQYNPVYRQFVELLGIQTAQVKTLAQIPCLPISCFKNFELQTGNWVAEAIFTSSGTTGQQPSRHLIKNMDAYLQNARRGFESFYGAIEDYCILALLPSYLERQASSLVAMTDDFIKRSKYPESGFFLNNTDKLLQILARCQQEQRPTLLLGVSFALLDLAEQQKIDLSNCIIMETGGMKGRRKEIIRPALHETLCTAFNVPYIHSEYGMTELLSQAYSKGAGIFQTSPSMQVLIRDISDPLNLVQAGKTGVINIIDLANLDSCAFIATQDLGKKHKDASFEVLGRFDHSDIRGCNLMLDTFK